MSAEMRTGPGARHSDFRGIDPAALNQLIRQVKDADNAIKSWLSSHRPPAGVPATGHRQADQVARWAADQLGMLSRRYNFAITHPDRGGGVDAPPAAPAPESGTPDPGTPRSGGGTPAPPPAKPPTSKPPTSKPPTSKAPSDRGTTPRGAGDLGEFPTRQAALKAAKTDALAVVAAVQDRKPVPDPVWKHLKANADDPDYTEKLYDRLGPAGIAELVRAAEGDQARLAAIRESIGVASHHLSMDVKWLRALLAEADRTGVRPVVVQVLTGADMTRKTREALAGLGLRPGTRAAAL
ncbi:hypothetical protein [Spirillospora sp. NPDC047279]|uniref:hypothetical protein n=1 Tax=Spirillospora sp. NPDC047279 TaxID=3155478 RepID=UPI0033F7C904